MIALSDGLRTRFVPPAAIPPPKGMRSDELDDLRTGKARIFHDEPLVLHHAVVYALWGIDEGAEEAHRRLRPYDGCAKDLSRDDVAEMAARCALAVRHLVNDESWGDKVWPLIERVADREELTVSEWRAFARRTRNIGADGDDALYVVCGAYYRRRLGTTRAAASALQRSPANARYLDFLVELAELTSR
jgi:hypothetical protein